jgi:DNA-binding MarR family transcriptional regulator
VSDPVDLVAVLHDTDVGISSPLDGAIGTFRRWLHLPDPGPLLAVLGAVAANLLDGDPVWLLLVGPPGGGKSEILQSLSTLPNVHASATLTEAALLSGTPNKERATEAKGGLLRVIGDFGIIVAKDFGSVLSMNRDSRAAVLAALREIYDGSWTRHVGTDGGKTLSWSGKVGLVAGCTPTIDRHHSVMGAMGERFVLFRLPAVDEEEHARRALAHAGREAAMRRELAEAIGRVFSGGLTEPRDLTESDRDRLIALTTFTVRCRSSIERDGYTREIELIPEPEAPTRLIVVLSRLLAGLDAIRVDRAQAWTVVTKASLDSIPATRRAVIDTLLELGEPMATPKLAEQLGYPTATAKRALEDLTAHGIVRRAARGEGTRADTWDLTDRARQQLLTISNSEMSEGAMPLSLPLRAFDDKSEAQHQLAVEADR